MKRIFVILFSIAIALVAKTQTIHDFIPDADRGDVVAMYNLGICYRQGYGCTPDLSKSFYWFRKAAEQGYAFAQYNLGVCYENGEGVAKDCSQAWGML